MAESSVTLYGVSTQEGYAVKYQITVTASERNPAYVAPNPFDHDYRSREEKQQPEFVGYTVLSCELTEEQWAQLKIDTLRAWSPTKDAR